MLNVLTFAILRLLRRSTIVCYLLFLKKVLF